MKISNRNLQKINENKYSKGFLEALLSGKEEDRVNKQLVGKKIQLALGNIESGLQVLGRNNLGGEAETIAIIHQRNGSRRPQPIATTKINAEMTLGNLKRIINSPYITGLRIGTRDSNTQHVQTILDPQQTNGQSRA